MANKLFHNKVDIKYWRLLNNCTEDKNMRVKKRGKILLQTDFNIIRKIKFGEDNGKKRVLQKT